MHARKSASALRASRQDGESVVTRWRPLAHGKALVARVRPAACSTP